MPRFYRNLDGAVVAAAIASIGNMVQGWDSASIAGAMYYIKKDFNLQSAPLMEGSIMAIGLVSATIVTTISGVLADKLGRRWMLFASATSFFISAILNAFAWNVYMLLFIRVITGVSISVAVTIVPLYISEIAPARKRGLLNTFPQFSGSGGMFLSYCVVFGISLMPNASWRIMLMIQSVPSAIYLILILLYLPESPKWLVSRGRVVESIKALQILRMTENVAVETALLIEGMGGSQTPHMEEYFIGDVDTTIDHKSVSNEESIKLYGLEEDSSCIAYPINPQSTHQNIIRLSSSHAMLPLDPIIDLIGSVNQESSIFNDVEDNEVIVGDEENQIESKDHAINCNEDDVEDSLYNPLINRSTEGSDLASKHGSGMGMRGKSSVLSIGGGWQLAWKLPSDHYSNGKVQDGMQRMYIHEEVLQSLHDSDLDVSLGDKVIKAAALVNNSVLPRDQIEKYNCDLAKFDQPDETHVETTWTNLLKPGVKRALIVAIGIQLLQQFAGINGVLYYTPQILDQAGVGVLLSNIGLSSSSASILISAATSLVMLPFIGISMWLIDRTGRRKLLLLTIPILLVALVILVVVNIVTLSHELHAVLSTISVATYLCVFVMGFGPIPNILCAEIFPTNARAICSTIYGLTFWICDIIVTYSLPMLMTSIGLAGVFGICAIVCGFALIFVLCKVPETKGAPVEVIVEFFSLGKSISDIIEREKDQTGSKEN